jgi:flagellar biosynthesis/type III secretory pathway M-ring protein FliF/YscJ
LAEKAQAELTPIDAYKANILWFIKLFYKWLIGGLISFMIIHQILDYFATRREHKKEKH